MLQTRHAWHKSDKNCGVKREIKWNLFTQTAEEITLITATGCICQEDDDDNPNFTRSTSRLI